MGAGANRNTSVNTGLAETYADLLEEIAKGAPRREQEDLNAFDVLDRIRETRLGAVRLPAGQGGAGASLRDLFALAIDLAEADPNVPHILRVHYGFVELQLISVDPARPRWLAEIAAGRLFGNASTELGTRAAGGTAPFATTLVPDGDGYRLNGTKYYSTGTLFADWVISRVSGPDGGIVTVAVPTDRPGVIREDDWDGIGQRRTGSGTTRYRDVRVERDEIINDPPSQEGDDLRAPSYYPTFLQLWLHAIGAGIMRSVLTDAVQLVRGRGRSFVHAPVSVPAEDPILHEVIGEISAASYAFETLVLSAAEALDAAAETVVDGAPDRDAVAEAALRASQVKVHLDGLGTTAATRLFDVGGASATKRSANLDRHWRNLRTLASHNPTPYKAQAIGRLLVTGAPLPRTGYF